MDENKRDELLSAYLDGELEAAEAARIEQLLGEDEQARATLEEMQAVRRALRALPRHALDAAFAGGVIRRAERAVLSGSAATSEPGESSVEPASHLKRHWRRIVWPLVAVAAALLVVVNPGNFFPTSQNDEPSVALQDDDQAKNTLPEGKSPELEAAAARDRQGAVDRLAKAVADSVPDNAKESSASPGDLADTVYVICEVGPNMSPREVARKFESRYTGVAKGNKYRQAAGFGYADAAFFELTDVRVVRQRRGTVVPLDDADPKTPAQKNESQPAGGRSADDKSRPDEPDGKKDDGAVPPKKQPSELPGEARLVATMTDDQLRAVVGQLQSQRGWKVAVVDAEEALREEASQQAVGRLGQFDRLTLNQQQNSAAAFAARPPHASAVRAEPKTRLPSAVSSKAGEAGKLTDAPRKSPDKLARARSQRFKSDKSDAKQRSSKDKKLAADAPAEFRPPATQDEDAESVRRAVGGKSEPQDNVADNLARPAPPRRVVFIFRAAAIPQTKAAEPAK